MKKIQKIFAVFGFIVFVYLLALGIWHIFVVKVKYALVCDTDSLSNCQKVEAKYSSLDPMDGVFFVSQLKLSDQTINYGSTDCTVLPSGSKCMDSSTGQNNTGSERVIIPLKQAGVKARW